MKHTLIVCLALALLVIALPMSAPVVMAQGQATGERQHKPLIAVFEFENKVPSGNKGTVPQGFYQWHEDFFKTELEKTGKVKVLSGKQLRQRMKENNLIDLNPFLDLVKAQEVGKVLGVQYILTGSVTEYGNTDVSMAAGKRQYAATVSASLINTSTGKVVWTGDERNILVDESGRLLSNEKRRFDLVMKPALKKLATKIQSSAWQDYDWSLI